VIAWERWYYEGRRYDMRQVELVERHLREADSVAGVLAASWEIFELIGALAAASADEAVDMYPAFMFARGSAVNGRDAIAFAPSLSAGRSALSESLALPAGDVLEMADALAGLAAALSARLREAAGLAADDGDRIACQNAARDADQIVGLLAGST
jgi:hypothetical protein